MFQPLIQQFIRLCDLPDLYEGLYANLINIDVTPMNLYVYRVAVGININCTSLEIAERIDAHYYNIGAVMEALTLSEVSISLRNHPVRTLTNFYFLMQAMTKKLEFDLQSYYESEHPVYIVSMQDRSLLFANPAALLANQKMPQEFLGKDFSPLSYPDELEARDRLLRLDGKLTHYEFKALNYYRDGILWRRKEMNFVSDIKKVEFLGVEAQLGIDYLAEETRRFVD
ncbi:MAG: hypothetical protein J7647_14335 [Cyanobacteria bacterium SBLK]|nr:hypothetical protein [Cyanobacteria bacterium SBLK]